MAEMNKYFDENDRNSSSHWFSVNSYNNLSTNDKDLCDYYLNEGTCL